MYVTIDVCRVGDKLAVDGNQLVALVPIKPSIQTDSLTLV